MAEDGIDRARDELERIQHGGQLDDERLAFIIELILEHACEPDVMLDRLADSATVREHVALEAEHDTVRGA